MSFRAVAAFLIDCVEQRTHAREVVGLAAPRQGGRKPGMRTINTRAR